MTLERENADFNHAQEGAPKVSGMPDQPFVEQVGATIALGQGVESRFGSAIEKVVRKVLSTYQSVGKPLIPMEDLYPQVLDLIAGMEGQKGSVLTDEAGESEVAYLAHFGTQHLLENRQAGYDSPQQVHYPRIQGQEQLIFGTDKSAQMTNYNDILAELEPWKALLEAARSKGPVITLSNHISWYNLGIIVPLLNDLGVDLDDIGTVIGSAVTTFPEAMASLQRISNVYKTWPVTRFANVGGNQFKKGSRNILRDFDAEFINGFLTQSGNVAIMNPAGTRDKVDANGVHLTMPKSAGRAFVHGLTEKASVFLIGVNEMDMVDRSTMAMKPGQAFVSGELFEPGSFEDGHSIMEALSKHVKGPTGIIGRYDRNAS